MPSSRRQLASLAALLVAAVASIATSPHEWYFPSTSQIVETQLLTRTATVSFQVQVRFHPGDATFFFAQTNVEVALPGVLGRSLIAETSTSAPALAVVGILIGTSTTPGPLTAPVYDGARVTGVSGPSDERCHEQPSPCEINFRVQLSPTSSTTLPQTIEWRVVAFARGGDEEPPNDFDITFEITPEP